MVVVLVQKAESSDIGKSPKCKPLQDELVLPENTAEWGKLLFDRIVNIEVNLNSSLDYIVDVAAEALIQVDDVMQQLTFLKSDYKALHEKVTGMENHSRRSNIGISKEKGETDSNLNKVHDLLNSQVGIPPHVLN